MRQLRVMDRIPMSVLNLCLLLLFSMGHAVLWIAFVNRTHARPVPCRQLRRLRHLHDVMVPAFPLVLLWSVGLRGPGLLYGGSWSEIAWGWKVILLACGLGLVGLLLTTLRHLSRRPPGALESNHSTIVDVSRELGHLPCGPGPFAWMVHWPGNEVFTVEVATKTLILPQLPGGWDGARILHLSDWHLMGPIDRVYFERLTELSRDLCPDLVVFTGDLLDRQELLSWVPMTLGRLAAPAGCYFILGNHDWYLDTSAIRECLGEHGWLDVSGRSLRIERQGALLHLAGDETPWMGEHPDLSQRGPDEFQILLSHTPDNLAWARLQGVDLMLSGHNHGGQVVLPVVGPIYAPSQYGVRYSGGLYYEAPTLLHVSRGVSGRHPLRIGCRPEVTLLVLKRSRDGSGDRHDNLYNSLQ